MDSPGIASVVGSETRAVDLLDIQRVEIGARNAAQVDRRHLRAVGAGAHRKALAPAGVAELMVDIMLVELVRRQPLGAALQPELVDRHEAEQKALAAAVRAVAAHRRVGNVALDAIGHRAAVTASFISHVRSSPFRGPGLNGGRRAPRSHLRAAPGRRAR